MGYSCTGWRVVYGCGGVVRSCNQVGCENDARANGKECRKCYRKLWMRRNRHKYESSTRPYEVSLDAGAISEIDRMTYQEWMNEGF